jgi:hypothetical protein
MAVWLGPEGLDPVAAAELQRVGVDEVVVRRGSVSLAGGVPVLRLQQPVPPVATSLPVGLALTLEGTPASLDPELADRVWAAMAAELGGDAPAEILLDLPTISSGLDLFVVRLAAVANMPVVPILFPGQLAERRAVQLVAAAGSCLVPVFGEVGVLRPGTEAAVAALEEQLAPLAETGARVRVGVVLAPLTEPALAHWGEPVDALCEDEATEISTSTRLDRTFTFRREANWSGRTWHRGETLAARWLDPARLNAHLAEIGRLVLPEVGGFDLIPLPPTPQALGMGRETLLRYLAGEGPVPDLAVRPSRSGAGVSVRVDNPSAFGTALSSSGNWVEVSVESGALVAEARGSFDRILLGTARDGQWHQGTFAGVNAVRFVENMIGAGESVQTGLVRVGGRGRVLVRWQMVLSTGETLSGAQRL